MRERPRKTGRVSVCVHSHTANRFEEVRGSGAAGGGRENGVKEGQGHGQGRGIRGDGGGQRTWQVSTLGSVLSSSSPDTENNSELFARARISRLVCVDTHKKRLST